VTAGAEQGIRPSDREEAAEGRRRRIRRRATTFAIDAFLLVFGILMLLPLILLVANAFKTPQEMLAWPPTIVPRDPTIENFRAVIGDTPLMRWILNSFLFAVMSATAIVTTSAIAGYILAKFRFFSLSVIFMVILATAIVPFEVYMIPLYFQVQGLGLLNTVWGLLIGYLVMSFGIFLIRQNAIHAIPDELLEAARIDGAGEIWIFVHVVLPLMRGALGALAVLAFFQAWTAFAWPLIVATTRSSYTIEVGLALFQTGFTIDLGRLSAASALVLVPSITLFVILRRNFVQGIAATGLKE
jgi:multiple sugar transport system permease protein